MLSVAGTEPVTEAEAKQPSRKSSGQDVRETALPLPSPVTRHMSSPSGAHFPTGNPSEFWGIILTTNISTIQYYTYLAIEGLYTNLLVA